MDKQQNTDKTDTRTRNWSAVVYPESAPENWREILDELHIAWIESPLHDQDTNADGTPKKAHWHIGLFFEGKQSYEKVQEITDELNAPIPQRMKSAKGFVRYMAHLDNPEKHQYSVSEIRSHGGADVKKYLTATAGDRYVCIREMITFIKENEIIELQDLIDYAMENRYDDWFPLLCDNSCYIISNYIKSARHRAYR